MTRQTSPIIKAAFWMVGAIVSFPIMALAGRTVSAELDTFEIMLYRSLTGIIVVFAVSGAIGGAMVELDVRTLYLKDLSFFGCTVLEPQVFQNLVNRIEKQQIGAIVAESYPLADIHKAQDEFLKKKHVGKIVLEVAQS